MSRNRFDNALAIQQGACNPSGIAISLLDAIREAREENPSTDAVRADPACRLICHQLAYLLGVREVDDSPSVYSALIDACEQSQTGETVKLRTEE
jgi:hypothetical protein